MKNLKFVEIILEALAKQFGRDQFIDNQDYREGIVEGLEMALRVVREELAKMSTKK